MMVSVSVRFAEDDAVWIPVLMLRRSLVLRVRMGMEVRRVPDHWGGDVSGCEIWIGEWGCAYTSNGLV